MKVCSPCPRKRTLLRSCLVYVSSLWTCEWAVLEWVDGWHAAVERRLIGISGGSCLTPRRRAFTTTTHWPSRPPGIDRSTVISFPSPSYRSVTRTSHTYILLLLVVHRFNGLFSKTTWYQKGKTSLDLSEARDDGVSGCSGNSWTICKQHAPHSRQITTPTAQHSIFTGQMRFLTPNQQCQSTDGKYSHKLDSNKGPWTVSKRVGQAFPQEWVDKSKMTSRIGGCKMAWHQILTVQLEWLELIAIYIFNNAKKTSKFKTVCKDDNGSIIQLKEQKSKRIIT